MRVCQRVGCDRSLEHLRADALYCGSTCRRMEQRSRGVSDGPKHQGYPWARLASRGAVAARRTRARYRIVPMAMLISSLLLLAGCGGSTHTVTKTVQAPVGATGPSGPTSPLASACPPGASYMGCSAPLHAQQNLSLAPIQKPTATQGLFPDVYEGQGNVNWGSVRAWQLQHGWHPAGIFKMGEFRIDNEAINNTRQLHALRMWLSGYWFVRNTGCQNEGDQIIAAAHALGVTIVSLDLEVPEAAGYGACLTPYLQHHGFIVVQYTSPGSNPGGLSTSSSGIWQAEYGPVLHPISNNIVAWQCSDGVFGCATFVPGVGSDDVSIDKGITSLGVPKPPPPDPYAKYPKVRFNLAFGQKASEYNTVKTWDANGCENPVLRDVCKSTRFHLQLLRDRAIFVATHELVRGHWVPVKHARYAVNDLGLRVRGMELRLTAKPSRRCTAATCG